MSIQNFFFKKHLNKVILAIILLILRIWVALNTSVASVTSTDLISSLASMTSTASLASKNKKQPFLYILSDFPGIWNLSGLNDLYSLNNLTGLNDLDSLISSKKLLILTIGSSLALKLSKPGPFCEIDNQKLNFLLISDTLSVRGCWGHSMLIFWKLIDGTQISTSSKATIHHNLRKSLIFLPLRAI